MDKTRYLAELNKLLGFMSSWDRQAALKQFEQLWDDSADPDALMEELGTPTRVAVELARSYVPSPPPTVEPPAEAEMPAAEESGAEVQAPASEEAPAEPEAPAAGAEPAPAAEPEPEPEPEKPRARAGGAIAGVLLFLAIGLPVTLIALCVGLPFLSGGIAVIVAAVNYVLRVLPNLMLVSDILLMLGGGCGVSALGLLLACFGLWLSVILAWLWLSRPVLSLWRRLVYGKEAVEA